MSVFSNVDAYPGGRSPSSERAGSGAREGLGRWLLDSLKGRMLVPADLRAQIEGLPDDLLQLSQLQRENFATRFVDAVWLFGGTNAPEILNSADQATNRAFGLVPTESLVAIDNETTVVTARRELTKTVNKLGFSTVLKTKVATVASELGRNICMYAGSGSLRFVPRLASVSSVEIIAADEGPGIENVDDILAGNYHSRSGLGLGLRGVKSVADEFSINSTKGRGTTVKVMFRSISTRQARR